MSGVSEDPLDSSPGAVDAYQHLWQLLPKLVQPSWYKHVHSGMYHENRHRHDPPTAAVEKAKRRETRKRSRLQRALAGEHTRAAAILPGQERPK